MPPSIKSGLGGFTRLSQIIPAENPDGLIPYHMEGHDGNFMFKIQI
jgi:hypothetical protein